MELGWLAGNFAENVMMAFALLGCTTKMEIVQLAMKMVRISRKMMGCILKCYYLHRTSNLTSKYHLSL